MQVRNTTAVLVEAGLGNITPTDVFALMQQGSRQALPRPAPPEGLFLVNVGYPHAYLSTDKFPAHAVWRPEEVIDGDDDEE